MVWVIPIISRSKEGIVVPEVGAGGGGRDLHQSSELELSNINSMSEVEQVCQQTVKEPNDLKRLLSKIESAHSSREVKMSLQGIDLDAGEEITLHEFAERLLALDNAPSARRHSDEPCVDGDQLDRTIRFPYSRHSSYKELCDFVAVFKPRDIYPCTVEEQAWTEDISMRALFGHLCSGTAFLHDEEMRLLLHERLENRGPPEKRQKRNDTEDTQASGSPESSSQEYNTAAWPERQSPRQVENRESPKAEDRHVTREEEVSNKCGSVAPNFVAFKASYESHRARSAAQGSFSSLSEDDMDECEPISRADMKNVSNSQISISQSAFDSHLRGVHPNAGLHLDGLSDNGLSHPIERRILSRASKPYDSGSRRRLREQAYRAAKLTLQTSDSGAWDDLGIRCTGNSGHCEPEEEL